MLSVASGAHKLLGPLSPISLLSRMMAAPEPVTIGGANPLVDGPVNSVTRAMTIPPIHVDHVGEAVCESIKREDVNGPVGVWEMRRMIGWVEKGRDIFDTFAKV
jgi:hypothetical protein